MFETASVPAEGATSTLIVVEPVFENCKVVGQLNMAKLPFLISLVKGLPTEFVLNEAVAILELDGERVLSVTVKVANIEVVVKSRVLAPSLLT